MAEAYTVSQVNNYIKNMFARDFALNRITVKGEVSNCKYHTSGHIYFTLKDKDAAINCVMFASQRQGLEFRMADGLEVEAAGQITVYEKSGSYQLYVRKCKLAGEGELYERFLKLKRELEEMGMFDELYKKEIPAYCTKIGIATALTGAAIRDIINVSKRRNPYVELVLSPTLVQGEAAAESIVRSIQRLDRMGLDVIIIGRGGGSMEDLWAFNEEIVAKAIFDADTPIISAVGHETDFTIADFVADMRAPTPSAAAELANFEYEAFCQETDYEKQRLKRAVEYKLNLRKSELNARTERLKRLSPQAVIDQKKSRLEEIRFRITQSASYKTERASALLDGQKERLLRAMGYKQLNAKKNLEIYASRLDGLSPLKKMSAGYGYLTDAKGSTLRSVLDVQTGDMMTIYMQDGKLNSRIENVERIKYEG